MATRAPLDPAARRARRLGLLGGSFDPPHLGHLWAAARARAAFALEHVLFVPAARPPHKPERKLAEDSDRLEMLALLLAGEPACSVWGAELARSGPSFTVDTLRELRALVPGATRLFLILGEDNLPGFPHWREVEEIVRLAQPVVVHRNGPRAEPELATLSPFARTRLALGRLASPPLDASSSAVRAALEREVVPAELLPERLREFLARRALYQRP